MLRPQVVLYTHTHTLSLFLYNLHTMTIPTITTFYPSYIYIYINLGLFMNMHLIGTSKTYLQICLGFWFTPNPSRYVLIHMIQIPDTFRIPFGLVPSFDLSEPARPFLIRIPSGGIGFSTNSPFTPAWDVLSIRSASCMHRACQLTTP